MIQVKKLEQWLRSLPEKEYVGVDEGGLTLRYLHNPREVYIEVGGLPEANKECKG